MPTKTILFTILATCAAPSGTAAVPDHVTSDPPEFAPPPDPPQEKDHYFCCAEIGKGASGDGCVEIPEGHTGLCNKVLYCDGPYTNDDGKVTCL